MPPRKKPKPKPAGTKQTEEERRRAARRFVWQDGDIRWIVPPGRARRDREPKKGS